MDGPWSKFAPPEDNGPWSKFAAKPAPAPAAPLHDQNLGKLPALPPQGPLHDRAPMPLQAAPANAQTLKTDQVMSQGQQGGGPLVQAMLDSDRPIGQRILAGIGHEAKALFQYPFDIFQQQAQRERQGQPLTPQDAGDVLQAGAAFEGPRFHEGMGAAPKPAEAPARVEPPPLTETRAREAGIGAVAKVADRVERGPWERFKEPPKADPIADLEREIKALPRPKTEVLPPGKPIKPEDLKYKRDEEFGTTEGQLVIRQVPAVATQTGGQFVQGHPERAAGKYVVLNSENYTGKFSGKKENKSGTLNENGDFDKSNEVFDYKYFDTKEEAEAEAGKIAAKRRGEEAPEALAPKPRTERPPAPPPAKPGEDPWEYWKRAHETPEAKAAMKADSLKAMLAENYYGVPAKPDANQAKAMAFDKAAEARAKGVPLPPPVQPAAPAVPKKASSPKIKPTIPPGTPPHVAKLIEKGNNFFADQAKVQPPTSLSMTSAARVKRAKTMGFNTGLTLYHGTSKDFTEFDISKSHGGEYAIFTSDKPGISANYGGKHVLPLWGKFENPKTIENFGSYTNEKVKAAIKQAKAEGYTELILKGMHDLGGKQTQYLFFKPENLRARDAAVFDPKKAASPNLLSAAAATGPHATAVALPDPDIKGTVRTLADKLYRTERRHDATQREALEEVQKLPPEAARLGEKFFEMLEPGGKKPTLTPEEKALFDKHLKPWLQAQRDLYEEIKKLAPDMLPADYDPDYVHHLVEGKTPEFDEQIGIVSHEPNSPWFGSKTLPRTTRSLKNSKYYVREDEYGTREVVSIDDKGNVYSYMGKTKTNIPPHSIKGDIAPGETVSIAGKKWTIKRASVAEKEGATNIKYYKNAYLSTYSNVVRLQKVAEALKFFEQTKEQFQHDPQVMPLARWPGDKRNIPKDFRGTTLPGWEGWKFDPHLAETMDDWHNKPGEAWKESLKNITHGIVGTLFLLPFRHIANVAGHYYVGRMGDALAHGALPTGQHFARAMWDVLKQGPMTKDMLKAGSGMQLTKVLNADFNKQLLKGLEKQWKQNPEEWGWLFKKLGVNPVDIYNGWLKASSTAMWYMSDVMMQALVREKMARGMNLEDAIRSAEKDIPNYRINPRVMMDNQAGRAMSRYLQNNLFSVFGRYNNNKWRAVADMTNDIMKGGEPGTRKEGVAKALALASLVYFVGWPLTGAVQSLTGKKDKEASPFGPVDVTDKLKRFAELVAPQTMKRMGATDDQVDAVKLLQSFIGVSTGVEQSVEQGTGHNPFTNQEDMTLGERGQSLVETISPIQMATEMATGKTSLLEQALKSTIGMRSKPREAPVAVQKREEKARDKREMQQPINHAINQGLRKLQPFTPDAIVNRFLPSSQ